MTHIEQLIQDMCPEGVVFKTLGEVCKFQNGFAFQSSKFATEGEKILRITNIKDGQIDDDNLAFFNPADYKENLNPYKVLPGRIVIAMSGATTGKIGLNKSDQVYYLNQRVGMFIPNTKYLLNNYLFHFLSSQTETLYYLAGGGAQPNLSTKAINELEIPLPPLEIQERIVAILDAFSALAAELQAELQMRRKQYEYYRTQLLTPHSDCNSADNTDDCNWGNVKFSDVASYIRGVTYNKHDELHEQSDSAIKVLRANNITLESNSLNLDEVKFIRSGVRVKQEQYLRKNDIFICAGSGSKEHVGKVAFINEDMDYTFGGFMGVVRTREKVTSKFLYYILTSNIFKEYLIGALNSTTINNLNNTIMSEFSFMVPSLAEQERIVAILDKFEALTTSLSDGIPAEQAAQQKRYEYYRDQLLTFKQRAI